LTIAHLIYSEQVAGAEKYLLDLLPGLKAEGIECRLICVCPAAAKEKFTGFCDELNSKGVPAVLMTGTKSGFLMIAGQISRYLRDNDIHYLHAHLFKSDLLAVLVKKLYYRKIFLLSTKHGYEEKYLSTYPVHKGKRVYNAYYFISKYVVRNINAQFAVSKMMSDMYYNLTLTPRPVKYIHHGTGMPVLPEDTAQYRLGSPQLVIVGRIEAVKGHQYLFDAMPAVIKKFPDVILLIIGNGTYKEQLIKRAAALGIEKNILFMGYLQNPYGYISQSDILVQPSLFESFGLVYIESFALKVPVVAFDVPACNEIVINNETGLLAPMFNSSDLAEKIIYLLQNPDERRRIGENGYEAYQQYYNTSRMAKETAEWYKSVIT
jgi:glycosyltransferase involved in cell wall biosynthesis